MRTDTWTDTWTRRLLCSMRGLPRRFVGWLAVSCLGIGLGMRADIASDGTASMFVPDRLEAMNRAVVRAVAEHRCPGGVLWLERNGQRYVRAFGDRAVVPRRELTTDDTVFDAASLTKVLATAPAVLKLWEQGRLELDAPVVKYLPGFKGDAREAVTIQHLLTHTSGLRPGLPQAGDWTGTEAAIALACREPLQSPPGSKFVYSDINYILLGEIVHRASGVSLAEYCSRQLYWPLRMADTGFLPLTERKPMISLGRIAPTERLSSGAVLRGVVHDPTSRRMGGVAGHAGLFTTAADTARFARMFLQEGVLDRVRVFKPETIRKMVSVQTGQGIPRRGLGWDVDTPYSGPRGRLFPVGSYGHTGWTGTSLWIDPFSKTFVIFMSNRNHPSEDGNILALRRELGTLAAEAVVGFDWEHVAGSLPRETLIGNAGAPGGALNGIDVLERDSFRLLRGRRVGLITNHTGRDRAGRMTIDLLKSASGVELRALFSPEHGIRGLADEKIGNTVDAATGLPVYSLYGDHYAPQPEQLIGLDALVFDIQDIGCRFYTYTSTLGHCLEAAGRSSLAFYVLDRVNPIGGDKTDGPVFSAERSFVAWHEIPVLHGMTVGELAQLFNQERHLGVNLTVVPVEGWTRGTWFDGTGLPWVNPSPNMRSLTAATVYAGAGLIEYCAVSVGRGTATPFELVGAPYVNENQLAALLSKETVSGIRFEPVRFTPTASMFAGKECGGVRVVLLDREALHPCEVGIALGKALHRLYPKEFKVDLMQKLLGDAPTLDAIRRGDDLETIRRSWEPALRNFRQRMEAVRLYR
ncbi:MAG: DUF1343 domain-containing protein [Pedosphaera sp.]|nr:DUF1343 domain-containing protein [Pedosphaera sp.]